MARKTQPLVPARRVRYLQPLCLALLAQQPASGYDVLAALRVLSMFQASAPDAPGVYRTLQAFEKNGLISGRRRLSKKGPARREYTLTPAGCTILGQWRKMLEAARSELDVVIARVQQAGAKSHRAAGQRSYAPDKRRMEGRIAAPQRDPAVRAKKRSRGE